MSNLIKRISTFMLAAVMTCTSFYGAAFADDNSENSKNTQDISARSIVNHYECTITSRDYDVELSARKLIKQHTANRAGETTTAGASVATTNSVSGSLTAAAKSVLSATIGFDVSKTYTLSASDTCAPLQLGETVKCYYRAAWSLSKAEVRTYEMETETGVKKQIDKKNVIVKKGILPEIEFEYISAKSSNPYRITRYVPSANGVYHVVTEYIQ